MRLRWIEKIGDDGDEKDPTRMMESTRKRTSATFRASDEVNNEEAIGLLTNGSTSSQSSQMSAHYEGHDDENVRHRDRSKWLRPVSLVFAILLLTTITFASYVKLSQRTSATSRLWSSFDHNGDDNSTSSQMLGIELHPGDHLFRQPTTITHHWTITSDICSPDGVKKKVYLVNGEFPGPAIECRSGDRLIIHVTNSLTTEGVSIHWHGLHMHNANSMDGAVGFTQCSIPAGGVFTYDFVVDEEQSGTFWWHAHSQVERGDGLYGGLVVHKPEVREVEMNSNRYGKDVLLLIGDWYHRSAEEVLAWYTSVRGFGNEASSKFSARFIRWRASTSHS
jgi:FtsP/CotA-like multicopper oxidase with cupredoxin domain